MERRPTRRLAELFFSSINNTLPLSRSRDLSRTGVFLETDNRPAIGSMHELKCAWGDDMYYCQAKIVRHASDGIGLVFINPDTFFQQAVREILSESPSIDDTKSTTYEQAQPKMECPLPRDSHNYTPRAPRFDINIFVGQGQNALEPLGTTRNISISGFFVETTKRPAIGEHLDISVIWGDDTYTCTVRVVRHAKDGVGLSYIEPDLLFLNAIQELLSDR